MASKIGSPKVIVTRRLAAQAATKVTGHEGHHGLSRQTKLPTGAMVTAVENSSSMSRVGSFVRAGPSQLGLKHALRNATGLATRATSFGITRHIEYSGHLNDLALQEVRSILSTQTRLLHLTNNLRDEVRTVACPTLSESLSEGDIRWEKKVGDFVKVDETVGEVETDKTSIPINSPVSGIIEELLVEDGSTIQPGKPLLKIRVGGDAPPPAAATETPKAAASEAKEPPSSPPPVPPTPKEPIGALPTQQVKPPPKPATPAPSSAGPTAITGARTETRVKINRMRQRIAQRLKDAQNTYAMLTTFNEIDMSSCIELRNAHKDQFLKKHNLKLGFMSAFVKAAAYALQDQPVVNAVIDDQEIVYRDYIDISVAVATPKGLVVPVLRNVEGMNYAQIERAIAELGEKARNNALAIEDMDGGTFTISNGGVFGSVFGTPIINPPQSSILGMHGIFERPVAINGKVEVRPMMYVALTYDHRLIDGREAVIFLRKIKAAVEDPRIMLLDL